MRGSLLRASSSASMRSRVLSEGPSILSAWMTSSSGAQSQTFIEWSCAGAGPPARRVDCMFDRLAQPTPATFHCTHLPPSFPMHVLGLTVSHPQLASTAKASLSSPRRLALQNRPTTCTHVACSPSPSLWGGIPPRIGRSSAAPMGTCSTHGARTRRPEPRRSFACARA